MKVRVRVKLVRRDEEFELEVEKGSKVEDVLRRLGLNPGEYVTVLNGEVVPEDETIDEPAELKLVPVVSGG